MKILAIETSCDETAAAVVEDGVKVLSNVVASSATMHENYGGIVPEVAAREQLKCIIPVITEALSVLASNSASEQYLQGVALNMLLQQSVDAIAVTIGPGLIGSLLVGVETAKTIAFVTGKPIIPVNHVLAHMYANFIESSQPSALSRQQKKKSGLEAESRKLIAFPVISLVVSGGHTELYVMKSVKDLTWIGGTLDDAAGECFDKTARLLGFGNGGGAAIQQATQSYHVSHVTYRLKLPRPMLNDDSLNFSFSGLKTAILREWKKLQAQGLTGSDPVINALAYEIQEAITDILVAKTVRATQIHRAKSILLSGGVAANTRLREKFAIYDSRFTIRAPSTALCTDNACYIASYAYFRGKPTDWHKVTALPDLPVET